MSEILVTEQITEAFSEESLRWVHQRDSAAIEELRATIARMEAAVWWNSAEEARIDSGDDKELIH